MKTYQAFMLSEKEKQKSLKTNKTKDEDESKTTEFGKQPVVVNPEIK